MRNPWLALWLTVSDAWMGQVHGLPFVEMQRGQMRMIHEWGERAIQIWGAAWMLPLPVRQRPIAERMAELSLRVVAGGRH